MNRVALTICLIFALCSVACTSYDEIKRQETLLETSIDKFHEQLNDERYHEIYAQADEALRQQVNEEEFIKRLTDARRRTGRFTGKTMVIIDKRLSQQIHDFFSHTNVITDAESTACEAGAAIEKFQWSVKGDDAKLVSYELRQILERGKIYGIGPPDKQ